MAKNRVRIKDIAQKAKVSTGTVDRVIHKRGRVSDKAKAKVKKAIDELGYEKNIIASTLAYNKETTIGVLIPNYQTDLYWRKVERGIDAAAKKFEHFGVKVKLFLYDLFDTASLDQALDDCLHFQPKGVLFAPQFFDASLRTIQKIHKKEIPVFVINTYLSADGVVAYIGQNSYQSGVLAARLLSLSGFEEKSNLLILDISHKRDKGKHYIEKVEGFRSYFQKNEQVVVHQENIENYTEKKSFAKKVNKIVRNIRPDGVFITNSRSHMFIDSLEEGIADEMKIVGFDLLEPNINYLKEGKINFLINQNSFQQGYLGLSNIVNYLVFDVDPKRDQYLPLDIVVPENYVYYTNNSRYFEFVL